jgi:hypothetical protein
MSDFTTRANSIVEDDASEAGTTVQLDTCDEWKVITAVMSCNCNSTLHSNNYPRDTNSQESLTGDIWRYGLIV